MRLRAEEIATATGGTLIDPSLAGREIDGVSFDGRTLRPGQLFVPIVAERDGHDYLDQALAAGAGGFLTSRDHAPAVPADVPGIAVEDTAAAFLFLARWARQRFDAQVAGRVVGITGSVGKTSAKDFTAAVLRRTLRVAANERSYNNDQGLPHTVLNAPDDVEALVLEMGMRGLREIARLCTTARPHVGVVTRVAPAHTERVGGIEGVARAKAELVEALPPNGVAVLNADDPRVATMATLSAARAITFGAGGDVRIVGLRLDALARARFTLATPWGSAPVALPVSGAHNAHNAAAAAAVGGILGVPLEEIVAGLAGAELSPSRMELARAPHGALILNDAYNANPTSMAAALDTLAALPARRRLAVLGLMAELADPVGEHQRIAIRAAELGIEVIASGTDLYGRPAAADPLGELGDLGEGDAVLVKGSLVAGLQPLARRLIAGGLAA